MKTIILSIALFFCALFAPCTTQAQDKSLLYEISGNGLSKPSYVYGTIHIICPKDYFLTDATKNAISKAEQIYLEVDMDDPQMVSKVQKEMMFADGKTMKDFLTADEYTLLSEHFKQKMNINFDMMNRMKPFAVMSMLYMTLLDCQPESYEMNFVGMATKDKKEVLGLESIESQIKIFDEIPYQKQSKMLVELIQKKTESQKEFDQMLDLYKKQDTEGLLKSMDKAMIDFEGYEGLLLDNRNTAWIPVMQKAMADKQTFFGVGTAHLGGKKGVLQLLKDKGYSVKAVL
jgi:uncharacterized protein